MTATSNLRPCATCGGQLVDRDYDYGMSCLQCGRPAVKPTPPAWLLEEEPGSGVASFELFRRRRVADPVSLRRDVPPVTVDVSEMRRAMAVLR